MLITDSQVHLWGNEGPDRPWIKGGKTRLEHMGHLSELGVEQLVEVMNEAGVYRAVIVPPTWDFDRIDVALEAHQRYPDRFRVMTRIPLDRPDEAVQLLEGIVGNEAVVGVRLTFSFEGEREWIRDGTADWFWPVAEELAIPTMLLVPYAKREIAAVAERHPRLKLTIDHLGILGNTAGEAIGPYVEETASLSRFPNVSVKLSNLPSFSTEGFPWRDLSPHVERLVTSFGADRCFWGTDFSRMLGKYGVHYRAAVDHVLHHMPFLTAAEKELILGKAICDWLGWELPDKV